MKKKPRKPSRFISFFAEYSIVSFKEEGIYYIQETPSNITKENLTWYQPKPIRKLADWLNRAADYVEYMNG